MDAVVMERLSENLYRHEDSCVVYLLKDGSDALLVDFGLGSVLDELAAAGVERVTDVLLTHHHVDQAQGLERAAAAGIRIWVPHSEQDLFHSVEDHWRARELDNSYNTREDRYSLLRDVPVHDTLRDYAKLRFGATVVEVVPTPGHTPGSLSLLCDVDGRKVAFTGDLIYAPGQLWSLAATQWTYNGAEGVAASVASLLDLRERQAVALLPSHGEPMAAPTEAIDLLVGRLRHLLQERGQNPRLLQLREAPYERLTPHLLRNRTSLAYHYVLLSATGKALFIDFGYDFATGQAAGFDRASRRPWLYTLPVLKRAFGVTSIDVVVPTHYHDDHVAGLNLLREVEGTAVWAADLFAEVLERPSDHDLPCLWYDPVTVDRRLPLEAPITWEEYHFTLHHLPGHTHFAVAIDFEVDGKHVVAIGDQYQGGADAQWNYVYQNGFGSDDYVKSAALLARLRPELILSGHWDPLWPSDDYFAGLEDMGRTLELLHEELLPAPRRATGPFGAGGFVARIGPYRTRLERGGTCVLEVRVRNASNCEEQAVVELRAPGGFTVEPRRASGQLAANGNATFRFELTAGDVAPGSRYRVAADLTVGERRLGQSAEALISVAARA